MVAWQQKWLSEELVMRTATTLCQMHTSTVLSYITYINLKNSMHYTGIKELSLFPSLRASGDIWRHRVAAAFQWPVSTIQMKLSSLQHFLLEALQQGLQFILNHIQFSIPMNKNLYNILTPGMALR